MALYRRPSFLAGFAAGFVAGARSGKETYNQIVKSAQAAWDHPTVQQARGQAQTKAQSIGSQLGSRIPGMRSDDSETTEETQTTGPGEYAATGVASRPDTGSGYPGPRPDFRP
jgi:hypothetical protein